jgi:hypothetical protein
MRRVRLVTTLGVGLLAALALAACGGDSSPEVPIVLPTETSTTTGSAASKTDFIEQADAGCEEANAQIQQFASAGQGLTEADQIADIRQGIIDDLNGLGPPDEDRQTLDEYLTALEQQVEAGKKIALAQARGEDTAQFETELSTARDAGETAAAAYGFQECGKPISSSGTGATDDTADTGVVPAEPSAPVEPAPSDSGGTGDTGDTGGGTGDTGGGTGGTGGAGGIGPG